MDIQDGVGIGFVLSGNDIDDKEETDDVRLLVDALVGFLSIKTILHCLSALSEGHGIYFRLILAAPLSSLDVSINIYSKAVSWKIIRQFPFLWRGLGSSRLSSTQWIS